MSNSNKKLVPEAQEALDKFKMEAASEVGVTLNQGYNGDLSSKQAGSVGGQMVKNICPARLLKSVRYERLNRTVSGRKTAVRYIVGVSM